MTSALRIATRAIACIAVLGLAGCASTTPTREVLHKYAADYRVIFVGDASMSPLELLEPGGSIEGWNEESGMVWLQRVLATWPRTV